MKILISILSILIILTGLLPFFGEGGLNIISPKIPTSGTGYRLIIVAVGIAGILYAILNQLLFGLERFVTIIIAGLTLLGGVLPFFATNLPFPTTGVLYPLVIVGIGALGLVYGIVGIG